MLSRDDLRYSQLKGCKYIMEHKRCLLPLGMGYGKTACALTAIVDLQDMMAVRKVLIIAPLRVANTVWAQEVTLWDHTQHLRTRTVTGSVKSRMTALSYDADIYITNRESVVWLVELYKHKWPFDMVIVDESTSFKSPSSKRFKALKKVLKYTEYMVLLSGTPRPGGYMDLWSQAYLIDQGEALGRTHGSFTKRFFTQSYNGYDYTIRAGAGDEITALSRRWIMPLDSQDRIDMPPVITIRKYATLDAGVLDQYEEFEKSLYMVTHDGGVVEPLNEAILTGKLLQYASGAVYVDGGAKWSVMHEAKIEVLKDIVEDNPNDNIMIAYQFKSDLARLKKVYPKAEQLTSDDSQVKRWNAGQIKILLVHPKSAGHGLNLQGGGSMIIWYSLTWSAEELQQLNKRLDRPGQKDVVRIIYILATGTIDMRVMQSLESDVESEAAFFAALRNNP